MAKAPEQLQLPGSLWANCPTAYSSDSIVPRAPRKGKAAAVQTDEKKIEQTSYLVL